MKQLHSKGPCSIPSGASPLNTIIVNAAKDLRWPWSLTLGKYNENALPTIPDFSLCNSRLTRTLVLLGAGPTDMSEVASGRYQS